MMRSMQAFAIVGALLAVPVTGWAQSSPSAFTSASRYDALGRVTGTISPDPDGAGPRAFAAVRNTYDSMGRVTKVEAGELSAWQSEGVAPASWSGFTVLTTTDIVYDVGGKKLKETRSGGGVTLVTQFSYDTLDRLECTAVRMNPSAYGSLPTSACMLGTEGAQGPDRITRNVYDLGNQLIQIRKAAGTSLEQAYATYSYTGNGKQEYVIDANGNRAKLEYDGLDRQVKWIFPSVTPPSAYNPATQATALATAGSSNASDYEQYAYDANGNRTSLRKRDGVTLTYQFDALGRNTVKTVPERSGLGSTHSRDVYYSYDTRGLMTGARFDSLSGEGISTSYDGFGRIASSTIVMDGTSRQLTAQYDADGNRTRLTFPDSAYAGYAYDGLDRPQSVTGNAADWSRSYVYNASGALATDTASSAGTTAYGRDAIGRLTSLGRDIAGGTALDNTTTFAYNPASQIVQDARSNDAYAYTARPNVNRAYASNGLNQYTAAGSTSFCHDPNGNLTADGQYVYLYDVENRLVEKREQGGGNTNCSALAYTGALQVSLRYDPMGRLYESVGTATGTTRFLTDGDALVAEYDGSGTMLRRYVHGADGKADDPIAWYEGSAMTNGALRYLYANHQGSIVLTADNAGGASRVFKFDEYGIPQSGDGAALTAANGARFLYTGQAWMPDLGMYYYKARIYSPTLGRFMQTDPIGYDDQINLYAYVANDPVNQVDPDGKESAQLSLQGLAAIEADERENPGDPAARKAVTLSVGAAVSCAFGCRLVGPALRSIRDAINGKAANSTTQQAINAERAQLTRSERSLERNVAEHKQKLSDYRRNPDAMDNQGRLANARNSAERQQIIQGRERALQQQITKNENELAKVRQRLKDF